MADSFKNFVPGGFGLKPQSADPTNPKDGDKFQSDGTSRAAGFWEYKNGGWSLIGAGNSDLSIYSQFDAEDGSTTDFSNVAISASSPIAGDNSYTISTFPASFPSATLDERHANKTHSMECHYKLTSGTAKLLIKDNSANVLEELEVSSTDAEKAILTFYVSDSMTSVQLHIEDVSSATGLKIDDVIFSDDPFVYKDLINITDWEAYTPTTQGFGTIANVDVRSRRVGGSLEVFGRFNAGTPTASEARIYFPSGLTEKTGIVPTIVGHAFRNESLANTEKIITVISSGSDYITMGTPHKSSAQDPLGSRNGDNLVASGQVISFSFTVPIENWSASSTHVVTPASATSETITYTGFDSSSGTLTKFKTEKTNTSSQLITVDNTTYTKITFNKECRFVASASGDEQSEAGFFISLELYNNSATRLLAAAENTNAGAEYNWSVSLNDIAQPGDYLLVQATASVLDDTEFTNFSVTATPLETTFLAATPVQKVAYIKEVQANGVASHGGGSPTSGSYFTRVLNTLSGDSFVSLSSNQFTLPPGKYIIEARSGLYSGASLQIRQHKAKLYNITDSSDEIMGSNEVLQIGGGNQVITTYSEIEGQLNLSSSTTFEIRHRCHTSGGAFGIACGFGDDEVYTQVKITKIK